MYDYDVYKKEKGKREKGKGKREKRKEKRIKKTRKRNKERKFFIRNPVLRRHQN
jgi:hypothetical protein